MKRGFCAVLAVAMGFSCPAWGQSFTFSTLAGRGGANGSTDGPGAVARLRAPTGIAVKNGTVYFNEYWNAAVRKISSEGVVSTVAGVMGTRGSADGAGAAARFHHSHGIAIGNDGTLYASDCGDHTIRKITVAGVATTLAGLAAEPGSSDGTGNIARFHGPEGVAVDEHDNVFVADTFSYTVRKVSPAGVVTTLAGLAGAAGSADGKGSAARFDVPIGIAIDGQGILYVADGGFDTMTGNSIIRKVMPDGTVTTLAGLAGHVGHADGKGAAARFFYPVGIAADKNGTVYVSDSRNFTIRQITPAGVVTTIAGTPGARGVADGKGAEVRFNMSQAIAVDSDGTLYVGDTGNHTIRKGVRAARSEDLPRR